MAEQRTSHPTWMEAGRQWFFPERIGVKRARATPIAPVRLAPVASPGPERMEMKELAALAEMAEDETVAALQNIISPGHMGSACSPAQTSAHCGSMPAQATPQMQPHADPVQAGAADRWAPHWAQADRSGVPVRVYLAEPAALTATKAASKAATTSPTPNPIPVPRAKTGHTNRAWAQFCEEQRPLMATHLSNAQREKTLGARWRALSKAEKDRYNVQVGALSSVPATVPAQGSTPLTAYRADTGPPVATQASPPNRTKTTVAVPSAVDAQQMAWGDTVAQAGQDTWSVTAPQNDEAEVEQQVIISPETVGGTCSTAQALHFWQHHTTPVQHGSHLPAAAPRCSSTSLQHLPGRDADMSLLQEIFFKLFTPTHPSKLPTAQWVSYTKLFRVIESHAEAKVWKQGPGNLKQLVIQWCQSYPAFAGLAPSAWCKRLKDHDQHEALFGRQLTVWKFCFACTPAGGDQ